jgi:hypothetical protein
MTQATAARWAGYVAFKSGLPCLPPSMESDGLEAMWCVGWNDAADAASGVSTPADVLPSEGGMERPV